MNPTLAPLPPRAAAALAAYRTLCEHLGRAPAMCELARRLTITNQATQRHVEKLRLAGFDLPFSVRQSGPSGRLRTPRDRPTPPAEVERRRLAELLRTADRLLCRYGDPDDYEWARFRREAGSILDAPAEAVA